MGSDNDLDWLYRLSGMDINLRTNADRIRVMSLLSSDCKDIRDRAVYISGLRWIDLDAIDLFSKILLNMGETSDDIGRLMAESIATAVLNRNYKNGTRDLREVMRLYPATSLVAKAAYVGLPRINGSLSNRDYAMIDYENVTINPVRVDNI